MPPIKNPIFFVIGATGTGKSQVAVLFAQELKANHGYEHVVIVNCDVYQCFNALPISTNKPSVEEFGNVPHAFLGILESNGALSNAASCSTPEATAAHAAASQALKNAGSFNVHAYEEMVTSFITTMPHLLSAAGHAITSKHYFFPTPLCMTVTFPVPMARAKAVKSTNSYGSVSTQSMLI